MNIRARSTRRLQVGVLAMALAASAVTIAPEAIAESTGRLAAAAPGRGTSTDNLGAHDRTLLAQAVAKGQQQVTLMVATESAQLAGVTAGFRSLGGIVVKQVNVIGYLKVLMPTGAVVTAAALPGVISVDLDESVSLPKPEQPGAVAMRAAVAAVGPGLNTPADNAFLPTGETGAVEFKTSHPTWDGRGVTIGIMDSGVDLDNPALQTTTTGERKIVDWFTATDPVLDHDGTWRPMLTTVGGPTFTFADQKWTAPAGRYQINEFAESATAGGRPAGDVNRDGDTTDQFGILYDPVTNDIRVDANQNNNFTDDAIMRPYGEKYDIGHFGVDNPDTPVREQIPFVVEFRLGVDLSPLGMTGSADFVNIGIVEAEHGTHLAGIAAANDMFGNANFDGAAPGAKIVSARACSWDAGSCPESALTDGMVDMVINRGVDIVNLSVGNLPALNDSSSALSTLYSLLINQFGVQIFVSAGNDGPGVNTVGDPSIADSVVSVAAGISRETWLANYGVVVEQPYGIFDFSSRGPREDGGFKPDLTAPGSAVSTTPMWLDGSAEAGYSLPPGYQMLNGTSIAAPQATGAAALLVSAAKATSTDITPASLTRALYSSARRIHGVPVSAQGNGRLNVPGAWKLLATGVSTRSYEATAPVCTALSDSLASPGEGPGIYNRCAADAGGIRAGQSVVDTIQLTRTSGPDRPIRHVLGWIGNDGTFRSSGSVLLPLNTAVSIKIRIRSDQGTHSAILRIDDPHTVGADFEIMNTVVMAEAPAAPGFLFWRQATVQPTAFRSFFLTVPKGAGALAVKLTGIAPGSQTRFIAYDPYGIPVESTSSLVCYTNFADPASDVGTDAAVCDPAHRSYQNPIPGVWEIAVESRRTSPVVDNPFTLSARIQGVQINPMIVQLPHVAVGVPATAKWTVTNEFGPVTMHGVDAALGSAALRRPAVTEGDFLTYPVVVPAGATNLTARISDPSDPEADLDLYLSKDGVILASSISNGAEESVALPNPAPGTYQVVIDAFTVPSGSTRFDYQDVFYSPALGQLSTAGSMVLAARASATISAKVVAAANPGAGRQLFGELSVVTDTGAILGLAQVLVRPAS